MPDLPTIPAFTTISKGAHKPRDIASELLPYANTYLADDSDIIAALLAVIDTEGDEDDDVITGVIDALEEHVPPYCSITMQEGDGAHLGVWPCPDAAIESAREGDDPEFRLVSDHHDPLPDDFTGQAVEVNERGNVTLWVYTSGEASEIWACV